MKSLDRKFNDKELELIAIALSHHLADYEQNTKSWKEGWALQSYFNDKANETVPTPTQVIKPEYDKRHGGPFDRGSADSYYSRPYDPHYYLGGTSTSDRVEFDKMTDEQKEAYNAGYQWNEQYGDKKDWS